MPLSNLRMGFCGFAKNNGFLWWLYYDGVFMFPEKTLKKYIYLQCYSFPDL